MQFWLAGIVCVSGFFGWAFVFRFSFVLMENRRCLYWRLHSLPLDNVLSQGGGPLAVEGVLLNSDVIYHILLCPTPSVTYGASTLQHHGVVREPFRGRFQLTQIGAIFAVSGNPKQASRTN